MTEPALCAYSVSDDENAIVVFAYTPEHAARLGGDHFGFEPEDVITNRCPEFDQYVAAGDVTGMQYLAHGWWMTCTQCQRRTSLDLADEIADEIKSGMTDAAPMEPQEHDGNLYCSLACREAHLAEQARLAQARADAEQATLARFPGVTIVNVALYASFSQVTFRLPAGGHATWTVGADTVLAHPDAVQQMRAYHEARK